MSRTVLIVDDERRLADMYADWMDDAHETRVAYDGESAMERLDGAVDIVLLDRHMPGMSGDEVLARVRAGEHDPWIAMVTAVDPEPSMLELPCNNYVVKPVTRYQLNRLIETVRIRLSLQAEREHVSLANRLETVESRHDRADLHDDETYQRALERLRQMADRLEGEETTGG